VSAPAAEDRRDDLAKLLAADGDRLYALALRVTRDPDLAADALQDGFASAIENIADFRDRSSLSTWLYRIVYNKAVDRLRRRKREGTAVDDDPDTLSAEDADLVSAPAWSRPPDEILLSRESREALEAALGELPAAQRAVFELREIDGRSTEEVAQILNLPEGTVRVYLHRARLRLRALLSPLFQEPRP
jgi:RNA polymerase sigma-70 factor (ECF subfamily)